METAKQKSNRGGARVGAGRPKKYQNTQTISLRIPEDVVEILSKQNNRSEYIIAAIRAFASTN